MKAKKSKLTGCPDALSSQCVIWNGAEIPCLGVSNGDTMSQVVCDIANKVCKIAKDIDVSNADLSCLIGLCDLCPEEKNLKSIIQLLLDNQCKLKDLIDNIDGTTADVSINLNLKCLKKFDDFGNEIPQDLNHALQTLVNEICSQKGAISNLQAQANDLQDQIDHLPPPVTYIEPTITTCITPPRKVSQAVPLIAQDYCTFKDLVGDTLSITAAISQQCADLNTEYQAIPGWQITVDTLAKSINNLWIMACNMHDDIKNIKENCCQITCDDVVVQFQVIDNETGDGVTIQFSSLYGNKIPSAFIDCGSTISFKDKNDKVIRGFIKVSQESTSQEYDLSPLDLSDIIQVSIEVKLCSSGLTCMKCVSMEHQVVGAGCPSCAVTIGGTSGSVTLFYSTGSSQDTITANVGDTVYVPTNAIAVSYRTNSGDAVPDTTCLDLTEAISTCYEVKWQTLAGANLDDMYFEELVLGANTWVFETNIGYNYPNAMALVSQINALNVINVQAVAYKNETAGLLTGNFHIILKVIGNDVPRIRITNPIPGGSVDNLYLVATESDCLPDGFTAIDPVLSTKPLL